MVIDFRDPEKVNLNSVSSYNNVTKQSKPKLKSEIEKKSKSMFGFKIKLKTKKEEKTKEDSKPVLRTKMKEKFSKEETILEKINRVLEEQQQNGANSSSEIIVEKEGSAESKNSEPQNRAPVNSAPNFDSSDNKAALKEPKFEKFEFRGRGREYFKIWIVNVALSLITLGIFSAWAKVRTNRYIYGNTYLKNSNFEFNADPKRIFIGRVIIVAFYGLFLLFGKFLNMYAVAGGIALIFALLFPWLMRQAISFKLKSASYRNIHFKFHAGIKSFYGLALITIVSIATIPAGIAALALMGYRNLAGIFGFISYFAIFIVIMPVIYRRYKALVINNSSFANAHFNFNATRRETIRMFLKIAGLTFLVGLVFGLITATVTDYLAPILQHIPAKIKNNPNFGLLLTIISSIFYLIIAGMYKGISDGYLSNFARNHTTLEGAKFKGEIKPLKLGWISMTNMIILVMTLGLAYPWTKFRYLKYKIENSYFACRNYDKFVSDGYENTNPIGEEAMDFFDIDIGV